MALVLSRRVGDKLYIQTNEGMITIEIAKIEHNNVYLAIDAPRSVNIYRDDTKNMEKKEEAS